MCSCLLPSTGTCTLRPWRHSWSRNSWRHDDWYPEWFPASLLRVMTSLPWRLLRIFCEYLSPKKYLNLSTNLFQRRNSSKGIFKDPMRRSRKSMYAGCARFGQFWLFCTEQVWTLPFNAMRKLIKAHMNWHTIQQNGHPWAVLVLEKVCKTVRNTTFLGE